MISNASIKSRPKYGQKKAKENPRYVLRSMGLNVGRLAEGVRGSPLVHDDYNAGEQSDGDVLGAFSWSDQNVIENLFVGVMDEIVTAGWDRYFRSLNLLFRVRYHECQTPLIVIYLLERDNQVNASAVLGFSMKKLSILKPCGHSGSSKKKEHKAFGSQDDNPLKGKVMEEYG